MSRAGRPLRRRIAARLPLFIVLETVWVLLWDSVGLVILLTGALVALGVMRMFRLPPVKLSGRFNILYFARFMAWFAAQVCLASVHVAWLAVRPRRVGPGSMVAVQLHTRSDLAMTLVSLVNGLLPGTFVAEVDRARAVLYLHALGANTPQAVERAREDTLTIERHLLMAMGSPHDLAALNEWRKQQGLRPVLWSRGLEGIRERRARRWEER